MESLKDEPYNTRRWTSRSNARHSVCSLLSGKFRRDDTVETVSLLPG